MELSAYFTTLQYLIMGATAVAIALIFLYVYHSSKGEEDEQEESGQLFLLIKYSFLLFANIACINKSYYIYAVTSIWKRQKTRSKNNQTISRPHNRARTHPTQTTTPKTPPTIKEYCATHTLNKLGQDILTNLQKNFTQQQANQIFTIAALRVIQPSPFKRIHNQYQTS